MLGDADGPQAYLRQVGLGQALAQSGTEVLAANQANDAVAKVFRTQAHKLLVAKQADLKANDLKVAIQAMVAWAHAGVQIAHWTGYQWDSGPHVRVSQLQRGDLLFYATNTSDPNAIHHVAIYIGNGMMVNAPYTGAFVRIDGMYEPGGFIGAVRPAG